MIDKCPQCHAELPVICVRGCRSHTCPRCKADVLENHSETMKMQATAEVWREWDERELADPR